MITENKKTYIAIFTYGGGMRGLIPAHIMSKIEERTGLQIAEMVDIFAGPSTGAILNAALTRRHPMNPDKLLYKAKHLVRFYERDGIKIFPPDSFREFRGILHDFNNRTLKLTQLNNIFRHGHYKPDQLKRSLRALYGDSMLSDSYASLIIPTYNIDRDQLEIAAEEDETGDSPAPTKNNFIDEGGHALWLKNINHTNIPEGIEKKTPEVSLFDAVMASTAAPTYFPCHHFSLKDPQNGQTKHISGIDGNIFDNPCISYLGAIRSHIPKDSNLIMILLGTGYTNKSVSKDDWNKYGALGIVDPVNDLPLINIFFHASESALLQTFQEEMGENLFVFNKSMPDEEDNPNAPNKQIDDANPENLERLKIFAEQIIDENKVQFDKLCDLLVQNYKMRKSISKAKEKKQSLFKRLFSRSKASNTD